jgi:hypothetical protein
MIAGLREPAETKRIDLGEIAAGNRVILDTSFTHGPGEDIPDLLYESRWAEISPERIDAAIEQINAIESLLESKGGIWMIEETKEEISKYLELLNNHRSYFNGNQRRTFDASWSFSEATRYRPFPKRLRRTRKLQKVLRKKNDKMGEWKEQDEELFNQYGFLCDKVFELIKGIPLIEVDRRDPVFKRLQGLAKSVARRRTENKVNAGWTDGREDYKHRVKLGEALETDSRIVATAAYLAYESPVLILTRDRDILSETRALLKMVRKINSQESPEEQIPVPKHPITIYGARWIDNGLYSMEPRVIDPENPLQRNTVQSLRDGGFAKGILY